MMEADLPQDSACSINLFHGSKKDHAKKILLEEKVRVTVMVSRRSYVSAKYKDFHKSGLQSCPTNLWPLALAKNIGLNSNHDE